MRHRRFSRKLNTEIKKKLGSSVFFSTIYNWNVFTVRLKKSYAKECQEKTKSKVNTHDKKLHFLKFELSLAKRWKGKCFNSINMENA